MGRRSSAGTFLSHWARSTRNYPYNRAVKMNAASAAEAIRSAERSKYVGNGNRAIVNLCLIKISWVHKITGCAVGRAQSFG